MAAPRAPASGAGIGLRHAHFEALARRRPALGLLEVHSENFFGEGPAIAWLERFRADYALSLHGVGLSLGSADPLDEAHLAKLEALVRRVDPALVSEHLSWSSIDGRHANELLPMPFTTEAAMHLASRVQRVQERLGRAILVENVSSYALVGAPDLAEWEFAAEVARRSGCALLLDVNNIWVNAANHGFDARRYLHAVDPSQVGQYHLGGFETRERLLVDTHGARVAPAVWELFHEALERIGARPTIVEWDTDLPALDVLLDEAARASAAIARCQAATPA